MLKKLSALVTQYVTSNFLKLLSVIKCCLIAITNNKVFFILSYIGTDCSTYLCSNQSEHHECANMGKVKQLKLGWQLYCTSLLVRDLNLNGWCGECDDPYKNLRKCNMSDQLYE